MQLKIDQQLKRAPHRSNIGWNNYDAYVKNGYKFKPGPDWYGLYYHLYLKDATGNTILTNDSKLTTVPQLPEAFIKLYVKKRGTIDIVEVTTDLTIIRYKTWSCGITSDWINIE